MLKMSRLQQPSEKLTGDYAGLFVLALVVRLASLLIFPPPTGTSHLPDSDEYDRLGRNLTEHGRYSIESQLPWRADLTRTPVYPVFVAGCYLVAGPQPLVVIVLQAVIGAGSCLAVFAIGTRLFSRRAGLFSAVLLAVDPLSARYAGLLLSETLFTALFALGLLCGVIYSYSGQVRSVLGMSLCFGAAALCRPIAVLWPLVVAAWMVVLAWRRASWQPIRHASLVLIVALLAVGLWVARNYAVGGLPVISTVPAINLYFHRAAAIVSIQEGISLGKAQQQLGDRLTSEVKEKRLSAAEEYRLMEIWGWQIVSTRPNEYFAASFDGAVRMMCPQDLPADYNSLRWMNAATLILFYVIGAWGAVRGTSRKNWTALALLFLALGYFIALSGPEAYVRFRVPIMPVLALLAGSALAGRSTTSKNTNDSRAIPVKMTRICPNEVLLPPSKACPQ